MQVVIEILESIYDCAKELGSLSVRQVIEVENAIKNGTPLPKGHGRLIDVDALFDYFGDDAIDDVTRSNIEYFIEEKKAIIIKADKENE